MGTDGDCDLSVDEVCAILEQRLSLGSNIIAKHMVALADTDQNGTVSRNELINHLLAHSHMAHKKLTSRARGRTGSCAEPRFLREYGRSRMGEESEGRPMTV